MATDEMKPRFKVGDSVYFIDNSRLAVGTVRDLAADGEISAYVITKEDRAHVYRYACGVFATKEEAVTWFTQGVE